MPVSMMYQQGPVSTHIKGFCYFVSFYGLKTKTQLTSGSVATITTQFQNVSIPPTKFPLARLQSVPASTPTQATTVLLSASGELPFLQDSQEPYNLVHHYRASFTYYNVFQIHPCCSLFLFLSEQYFIVWTVHILFIYSPLEMFFKVVMPRYFSTSNVRAFHFCYVPAKTCCCQSLSYSHSRGSLSTSYLLCHSVFHHFWAWSRTITELYPCIYDSFLPQIPFSILRPPYP